MRFHSRQPESVSDVLLDVAFACLGYEQRATQVPKVFFSRAARRVALGFATNKSLSYEANVQFFRTHSYSTFPDVEDSSFDLTFQSTIAPLDVENPRVVGVDISCFDRFRLAGIVSALWDRVTNHEIETVFFYYNIARFQRPSEKFSHNVRLQPVHPAFVGTRPDPLSSVTAIIGLGHEREKALGAAEYLESNDVFAFHPRSEVKEYYDSVREANALLLDQLAVDRLIEYSVGDPAALISDLSSLVRGVMASSSTILIPLGPKIFALSAMITALIHPAASVWRMTQMGTGEIADREPSEHYSVLEMNL